MITCKDTLIPFVLLSMLSMLLVQTQSIAKAQAGCGVMVSRKKTTLYTHATQVVMMREGTKTILSMQNDYEGPLEDFALVIPVPTQLDEDQVYTLRRSVFERLDLLTSPILVEPEVTPCQRGGGGMSMGRVAQASSERQGTVSVRSQFDVDEYQIKVLSADESNDLVRWLTARGYELPLGASRILRSYIQQGMYFLVATIDSKKVKYELVQGKKVVSLSPLQLHYNSDNLSLPIRLGALNAHAVQDLVVHIFATSRYEAANYQNVVIPTDLVVARSARKRFGELYAALFEHVTRGVAGAIVTEFAWHMGSATRVGLRVDPKDLFALGSNHIGRFTGTNLVLTRLHMRYDPKTISDDIVFSAAPALLGDGSVSAETKKQRADHNNFQSRYRVYVSPNQCLKMVGASPISWFATARTSAYTPKSKIKLSDAIKAGEVPGLTLKRDK